MNKQVSATKIYITYTSMTIYHLFYDFFQKPLCISLNYFNHHERFKTNANVKLTKSSQPLRYGIYFIVRRALKLITEQLQYGIYCIEIVVLKIWATTIFITNINQLHEIGKDLEWRTTYLEAASLPVKLLYEVRGRRSRARHLVLDLES